MKSIENDRVLDERGEAHDGYVTHDRVRGYARSRKGRKLSALRQVHFTVHTQVECRAGAVQSGNLHTTSVSILVVGIAGLLVAEHKQRKPSVNPETTTIKPLKAVPLEHRPKP